MAMQNTAKRQEWRQIMDRQQASGLSVRAFCRRGSTETSFYFWRRSFREQEAQQPAAAEAFVPAVVRKHRDAIIVGPPGVGKSHLVQSIGRQLIHEGMTVYYRSIFDCVRDFLHDEAFEGHDRVLKRYLTPDLLILDDMGMKHLPKKSGEFLFEIIMRRHELRSTMMTSNRPLEDWGKLIGDVPAATAILDRFLQDAELIEITGRSYRLRGKQADS